MNVTKEVSNLKKLIVCLLCVFTFIVTIQIDGLSSVYAQEEQSDTQNVEDSQEGAEILLPDEQEQQGEGGEIILPEEESTQEAPQMLEDQTEENTIPSDDFTKYDVGTESVLDENHVFTALDEAGNVIILDQAQLEAETQSMLEQIAQIESQSAQTRSVRSSYSIVNFRTKSSAYYNTNYTYVDSGADGYTNGYYAADAAFLGYNESGTHVKFMQAGAVGWVAASEVQILPYNVYYPSYYTYSNGNIIHHYTTNILAETGYSTNIGPANFNMNAGMKYYSYDGHYFYTSFEVMINDYVAGHRNNAVNANTPYYNYYQFLSHRSTTTFDATTINNYINAKTTSASKLYNTGDAFITYQNTYGVNALLMFGVAVNESGWGMSSIAQTKNNLFGHAAYDISPGTSSSMYSSVSASIKEHAQGFISTGYINPNDWRYYGGHLGDKSSGFNVKYASDPYWGQKAAAQAWALNNFSPQAKDSTQYTMAIKESSSVFNIRKEATTASSVLYDTNMTPNYPVIVSETLQGQFVSGSDVWYKVHSDAPLSSDRSVVNIGDGTYNFGRDYVYTHSSAFDIVHVGENVPANFEIKTLKENETYQLSLQGGDVSSKDSVSFVVWSAENGQDDILWVPAYRQGSGWSVEIQISDFKSSGEFYVHVYDTSSSQPLMIANDTFMVEDKIEGSVSISNQNVGVNQLEVSVTPLNVTSGVKEVLVPTWRGTSQNDIVWYSATKQSDGTYKVLIDLDNHDASGDLNIHTYIYNNFSQSKLVDKRVYSQSKLTLTPNNTQTQYTMTVNDGIPTFSQDLRIAVWSNQGNQDDLQWYNGIEMTNGKYTLPIDISDYKNSGEYQVHVYGEGDSVLLTSTFEVTSVPQITPTIERIDSTNFRITMTISDVPSKVQEVHVPIWSDNNQSDIQWFVASSVGNGKYEVVVNKNEFINSLLHIHIYARTLNGFMDNIFEGTYTLEDAKYSFSTTLNDNSYSLYTVKLETPYISSDATVSFAIWSLEGGQDDLIWNDTKGTNGVWTHSLNVASYKSLGEYAVHAYVRNADGSMKFIDAMNFDAPFIADASLRMVNINESNGSMDLIVDIQGVTGGVQEVLIPTWSKQDQSNIVWYRAIRQSDNTYKVTMDIANHLYELGNYQMHVYIRNDMGVQTLVDKATYSFSQSADIFSVSDVYENQTVYNLNINNVNLSQGESLRVAVWGAQDGQNDLEWIQMNTSGTNHSATMRMINHKETGVYYAHVYVHSANGSMRLLTAKELIITAPVLDLSVVKLTDSTFELTIQVSDVGSAIEYIDVPIWSGKNQSDIIWYRATKKDAQTFTVFVDTAKHDGNLGLYHIHVYTKQVNGAYSFVGSTTQDMRLTGQSIADAALAQVGVIQDCTMLVTNALKAVGIHYHGAPESYASLGYEVSASEAKAGDILVYEGHCAIYLGDDLAVHGGFTNSQGGNQTVVFSATKTSSGIPRYIRVV